MAQRGLLRPFTTDSGFDASTAFWVISRYEFDLLGNTGEIYLIAYKDRKSAKAGLQPAGTRQVSLGPKDMETLRNLKIADALPNGRYSTTLYGRVELAALMELLRRVADHQVSPEERDEKGEIVKPAVYEPFFRGATEAEEE